MPLVKPLSMNASAAGLPAYLVSAEINEPTRPAFHVPVRREGFVGQHLVVVPPPVRKETSNHVLLKGIFVTDAGYFPAASGHRVERPQGAATHLMIVCLHGRGWAKSGEHAAQLSAGDVVWLPADRPHSYGSVDDDPWTIVWAHFTGCEAATWLSELCWRSDSINSFSFGSKATPTLGLDQVYAVLENGYSFHHLLAASIAMQNVLCTLLDITKSSGREKSAEERTANVRQKIIESPARNYRLPELAEAAGLSVPHFVVLFKRQCGYAPIDFVIRQRIRLSCRLLDMTSLTISSVAEQVGFKDPYYFSRCFNSIMGSSPRSYRKSIKG
ncbi:MAG TPA: AraC family transcriptional regulator [Opitutaceae bacterium]|nr:AraC family transcriptional regulator [Opitutaceae bacterium]